MASAYNILPARGLVALRFWGTVSNQDLWNHARALKADSRFVPGYGQLSDLREVTSLALTSDGLRELATLSPFGATSRSAVVAPGDAAFGLARMYEAFTRPSGRTFRAFRDMDQALIWLELFPVRDEVLAALASAGRTAPAEALSGSQTAPPR